MPLRATFPAGPPLGLADLVLRPWFDRIALHAVAQWYFPLSRGWAAAIESGGEVEAFVRSIGGVRLPRPQVQSILDFALGRHHAYERIASGWKHAFFDPAAPRPAELADIEARRLARAHLSMAARSAFMPLHLTKSIPAVRWAIAPRSTVESRHGARLGGEAFPPRRPRRIRLSHPMPAPGGDVRWLTFPSRVGDSADTAWARVATPHGTNNPPTMIFLHGIAMETEFWRGEGRLMLRGLTEAGVRLIQPEGPWHGRRRLAGYYGGEPAMGWGPLGMLDLFEAWVGEVAALVAWARSTSRGPVAVGGVSLGALTSQLAASAAADWPKSMRPDALFLVATSGGVIEAASEGGLGRELGARRRLDAAGWSAGDIARWRPLLEPGPPALDPDRVVLVLGEVDEVTPYAGGAGLARDWQVPRANIFVRPQGHFSVALGLNRRAEPLRRLLDILGSA